MRLGSGITSLRNRIARALPRIWAAAAAALAILTAFVSQGAVAQNNAVTLSWDANPEPDIAGYRVHYGTASHTYTQLVDVGNTTTGTISNLNGGTTYFIAATAYNAAGIESSFSNEVAVGTPGSSPTPTPAGATPTPVPIPSPTPVQSGGPVVTSMTIVSNDTSGQGLMALTNGSVVNLATLPTQNINVQAFVSSSNGISQVVFQLGSFGHSEATSPYALCGDWNPCPANSLTALGPHSLQVTGYDSIGAAGPTLLVNFTVINQSTPSPTATASPVPTPTPGATPTPGTTPTPPISTPTPSSTSTPSSTPIATPTATPVSTSTPNPTPSPDPSATQSPIPDPTPTPAATAVPSPSSSPTPSPSGQTTLANVSTRLLVQSGNNVMVGGFIIYGDLSKRVMLRAIGPSLASFGVSDAMPDPALSVFDLSGTVIASNDNWRSNQSEVIQDTGLAPSDDHEAALVSTLSPGSYTAVVNDASNSPGVALFEFYDLDWASSQLINLSTRGNVQTHDRVMIGGFIIYGGQSTQFVVRAIGPSLAQSGIGDALLDPMLELYNGEGTMIFQNDNWRSDQEQEILDSTLAPSDDRESAIFSNLTPGPYSAIVRGASDATGVALLEIYRLVP